MDRWQKSFKTQQNKQLEAIPEEAAAAATFAFVVRLGTTNGGRIEKNSDLDRDGKIQL
jgi:hypothetical protein